MRFMIHGPGPGIFAMLKKQTQGNGKQLWVIPLLQRWLMWHGQVKSSEETSAMLFTDVFCKHGFDTIPQEILISC